MNILYFSWGENSKDDLAHTLLSLGHSVCTIRAAVHNYFENPSLSAILEKELIKKNYNFIFSFDYIPFLSTAADTYQIKYVSWIYDRPHWTLYSPTIRNECNYIFLFDKEMVPAVCKLGAKHAFHLPLACNITRYSQLLDLNSQITPKSYEHDLSFVGSLYENNLFRQINYLPAPLQGYLDGIIAAQKQLWGCSLIGELLTPDIVCELQKYIKLESNPACPVPAHDVFQNMILSKITSDERISYLNALAQYFHVTLYTGSNERLCPTASYQGTISYTDQMPTVFHKSKINLNITLRSIASGIPLRAIDIIGCGGFLLTNYQPELAEYLEPDRDFVYFESLDDLLHKADYYLSHDDEREQITRNGCEKVQALFSYETQMQKMLQICS